MTKKKKSHSRAPFMCGQCKAGFGSEKAVARHISDAHVQAGNIGIYKRIGKASGKDFDDDPSMADRAIQAEIDQAAGIPNDDDWLLP